MEDDPAMTHTAAVSATTDGAAIASVTTDRVVTENALLFERFSMIERYYSALDLERRKKGNPSYEDTAHGIWGSSDLRKCFDLFMRISLSEKNRLLDLGSGDGRIAMVAALFCGSSGVEGDASLHAVALRAKRELIARIPSLERCELVLGDYTAIDSSRLAVFDTFFIFADHSWPKDFETCIASCCVGNLYSYANIFSPSSLTKGPTIWLDQTPVVVYPLNAVRPGDVS